MVSLGVHIVDVLGRPVSHIPPGQGRQLLDEIRITAAGTAAGTSVDLAKLGAEVIAMGAIGDDRLADFLTLVLDGYGIDTRLLARKPGVQTSATILPIRANGERPALHTPGATSSLTAADIDLSVIETADVLHIGGPDVLGRFSGEPLLRVLEFARGNGVTTTMDVLSSRDASAWDRLRPLLRYVQYFLPNDEQLAALTGIADLTDAASAVLSLGAEAVLVSTGAQGCSLVDRGQARRPARVPGAGGRHDRMRRRLHRRVHHRPAARLAGRGRRLAGHGGRVAGGHRPRLGRGHRRFQGNSRRAPQVRPRRGAAQGDRRRRRRALATPLRPPAGQPPG